MIWEQICDFNHEEEEDDMAKPRDPLGRHVALAEEYMTMLFAIGLERPDVFDRTLSYVNVFGAPDVDMSYQKRGQYSAQVVLQAAKNLHVDAESLKEMAEHSG